MVHLHCAKSGGHEPGNVVVLPQSGVGQRHHSPGTNHHLDRVCRRRSVARHECRPALPPATDRRPRRSSPRSPPAPVPRATCGRPSERFGSGCWRVTASSDTGIPSAVRRPAMARIRSRRAWRCATRKPSSAVGTGFRKYPSRCTSLPRQTDVISIPGTTSIPNDAACTVASATAAIVSWSVTLIVRIPAPCARSTSSRGEQCPSDAVVWRWRSINGCEIQRRRWLRATRVCGR